MSLLGRGVLAFWHDIAPGGAAEFNHWHTREHIPERVGIPGFLRGRRYTAAKDGPAYFTLYETDSVATLGGADYVARLNAPTPWTQRALPLFRNSKRTACQVTFTTGEGMGGALGTLETGPAGTRAEELRGWLSGTALPAVADRPGVVGVHLCEADVEATQVKTTEKTLRDRPDALAQWVILVEAIDPDAADAAAGGLLGGDALTRHGAATAGSLLLYRLAYVLGK